ncbi:MAG TPA: AI-2E family transporter [Cyclobacteriaceae bacterium]|nr:AI-2E family transporter [Cyclobacteriaceae bacterium]
MEPETPLQDTRYLDKAVEIAIRLALLVFIFGWCFEILQPFFSFVLWGVIIAVAIFPFFNSLQLKMKGRKKLAASLITIFLLLVLMIPAWMLADSLWEGVQYLREVYKDGDLVIPPPGDRVKDWPIFAKPVVDAWKLASQDLSKALVQFGPQIKAAMATVFSLVEKTGLGVLQFMVSIILAGVFLAFSQEGGDGIRNVFIRLGGEKQGKYFAEVSQKTIQNVLKGVLGVAFIQSLLASIGFVIAGVPLAGLWTFLCLILAIMQIGVGPVVLVVVIYMFSTADTLTASLLTVWLFLVTLVDNFLKPMLMGKGAPVPMLIIFLGALGGFMSIGFLGLFLGAVILSLGYKLYQAWLETT